MLLLCLAAFPSEVAGHDEEATSYIAKEIYANGFLGGIAKMEKDNGNMLLKMILPTERHIESAQKREMFKDRVKTAAAEAAAAETAPPQVFPMMTSAEANALFQQPRVEEDWEAVSHTVGTHTVAGSKMMSWLKKAREVGCRVDSTPSDHHPTPFICACCQY